MTLRHVCKNSGRSIRCDYYQEERRKEKKDGLSTILLQAYWINWFSACI